MGCNSHLSIEFRGRWSNDTDWNVWALDLPESRNYELYEAMAGVRGEDTNAIVLPRGIPTDASRGVEYWIKRAGTDGHSHSWLSPSEFHAALEKVNAVADREWGSIGKVLEILASFYGDNNVRLIFFFDN